MVKKGIFELKKHGIPDAKVMAGVVLWVATTSFGERLGARRTFRLSAISPPVGGKSRSQSLFKGAFRHRAASITTPIHPHWHGFGSLDARV